jgi:hypothetical protein
MDGDSIEVVDCSEDEFLDRAATAVFAKFASRNGGEAYPEDAKWAYRAAEALLNERRKRRFPALFK